MVGTQFTYYEGWQSAQLECPACHWKGAFEQGEVGYHDDSMDCSCPKCFGTKTRMLATVVYPTLSEMKSSGVPADVRQAERIEAFQRYFDSKKLVAMEQLPDIETATFNLILDIEKRGEEHWTVIRLHEQVLFSEPTVWEGYEGRFEEVCHTLHEKYGDRVTDLVPSVASEFFLYGDRSSAQAEVERIREEVFRADEAWQQCAIELAESLSKLREYEYLVLCCKKKTYYVQFAGLGESGMRAEASSNEFLDEEDRLSEETCGRLVKLGWNPPTQVSAGSPNFFIDVEIPIVYDALAAVATGTLRDIYGIAHPAQLHYEAFRKSSRSLQFPNLRIARER